MMNRAEFLSQLRKKLGALPAEEIENAVGYYGEYFDDAGTQNEWKVLEELGSPSELAARIIKEFGGGNAAVTEESADGGEIKKLGLPQFSNIDVELVARNVEFVFSNGYGFEINRPNRSEFEWSTENGTLKITEKKHLTSIINFNFIRSSDLWLKIYVPNGADLESISISIVSGGLKMFGVSCSTLNIKTVSGSTEIVGGTYNNLNVKAVSGSVRLDGCAAGAAWVKGTSGSVKIGGINSKKLYVKNVSGSISVEGELDGAAEIRTVSGSARLSLAGKAQDFAVSFKSTSGSIYIDGEKAYNKYGRTGDFSSGKNLSVSTVSGNAHIDFANRQNG